MVCNFKRTIISLRKNYILYLDSINRKMLLVKLSKNMIHQKLFISTDII